MRLVIIGTGAMARAHAKAFLDLDEVEIVGVAGRSIDSLEDFGNEFDVNSRHTNIQNLYHATEADLAVISVDIDQTCNVLLTTAEFPWTILTEKPIGVDLTESKKLKAELGDSVYRIFVALNRRHYSTFQELIKNVQLKPGARIINVTDQEDQFDATIKGFPSRVVENWMFANSIHMIDMIRQTARGKIVGIDRIANWQSMKKTEHRVSIFFDSGDICNYQCKWNDEGPWAFSVETKDSIFLMKPLEKLLEVSSNGEVVDITPQSEWDLKFKPGIRHQAEMMHRRMKNKSSTITEFLDAFETMQLVNDIYKN